MATYSASQVRQQILDSDSEDMELDLETSSDEFNPRDCSSSDTESTNSDNHDIEERVAQRGVGRGRGRGIGRGTGRGTGRGGDGGTRRGTRRGVGRGRGRGNRNEMVTRGNIGRGVRDRGGGRGRGQAPIETESDSMDEQLARADNQTLLGDTTQGTKDEDTVSDEFEVPYNFEWVNPNLEFPVVPNFRARPGVLVDTTNMQEPFQYFEYFMNIDVMENILGETNRYAQQYIRANPNLPRYSSVRSWVPLDIFELKQFLGLTLLMGIVKKPAVSDFWSTDPLIQTPLFNSVMKRNRYQQILRFLHFNNNEQGPNPHDPNRDRMYKIRPLIDQLNELFMWGIQPEREICLDESLLLFKGRLQFRQYLPTKKS